MNKVILKHKKDAPLRRRHCWVFSGAIYKIEGEVNNGDTVEVYDSKDEYLATGHYHDGSIAVRVFSFEQTTADVDFWTKKIGEAYELRQALQLTDNSETNAYRLIHAEGDGLPGLILDYYAGVVVLQAHSIGMHLAKDNIVAALQAIYGKKLKGVYDKSVESLPREYAKGMENGYLLGKDIPTESPISEYGHPFYVNWETGQKTGFFLDQRENRRLLAQYSTNKTVLNAFCYSGGFSMYALHAGAKLVHSVDASQRAIDLVERNVKLLENIGGEHVSYTADVLKFLKEPPTEYDVMVLDPPAFAKNVRTRHNAVQGYKRLNMAGIKRIAKGGIIFTFSCSQVVDSTLFRSTVLAAALEAERPVRILHELTQAPCHPVNVFHPEVSYLKGFVLYVG